MAGIAVAAGVLVAGAAAAAELPTVVDPTELAVQVATTKPTDIKPLGQPFGPAQAPRLLAATDTQGPGVWPVVVIKMDASKAEAGLKFVFYKSAAEADANMQYSLSVPEARTASGMYDQTVIDLPREIADEKGVVPVTCGVKYAAEGDTTEWHQLACAYHPNGEQVIVNAYAYGLHLKNDDDVDTMAVELAKGVMRGLDLVNQARAELAASADVDPAVVGHWRLYLPTGKSLAQLDLVINGDATYSFKSNSRTFGPHAGHFEAADGLWSMLSSSWQDAGTYQVPEPDVLVLTGKLGTANWSRVPFK